MAYYQQPGHNPTYQPPPAGPHAAPYAGGAYAHPGAHHGPHGGRPPYSPACSDPDLEAGGSDKAYAAYRPYESAGVHANLRNAFLRKVYATLCLQFLVTTIIAGICAFHYPAQRAILQSPQGFLYGSMIPGVVVLLAFGCFQHSYPLNALLLAAFTVLESVTLGTICAIYRAIGLGDTVVTAAGLTAAIFVGLTLYVHASRTDFSFLGGFLMAGMLVMFLWGLLNLFLGWHASFFYAALGALLMVGMILFDTSQVLLRYGYDDHFAACIALYLDVINLFLYILQLLASSRRDDR